MRKAKGREMDKIAEKITEIIVELQPYVEFQHDTNLLQEEVLDSVSILVLIQEMEEIFDITVDPEEITENNFKTLDNIVEMVNRKIKNN